MVLFIFDWKTSRAFFFFSGSSPLLSNSSYQMELLWPSWLVSAGAWAWPARVWLGEVLLLLCLLSSRCDPWPAPSSASLL